MAWTHISDTSPATCDTNFKLLPCQIGVSNLISFPLRHETCVIVGSDVISPMPCRNFETMTFKINALTLCNSKKNIVSNASILRLMFLLTI